MDIGIHSNSESFVYVDDTKILKKINTEQDVEDFQHDLDENFYRWASKNNMSFNALKFVVLRYGHFSKISTLLGRFTEEF